MKIIGLTRIRNESTIIEDTLNHMSEFCDSVYIYDDASTDNTVEICKKHPIVKGIIEGKTWDENRARAEYENRQILLMFAREKEQLTGEDWFIYMDADERVEFDFSILTKLDPNIGGIKMRLFDFYITEEDKDKHYSERKFMGPEYRDILFMFKNRFATGYHILDQRECSLSGCRTIFNGFVKHYGKSISIQQWEDTCSYYADHFPKYSKKWEARKGKAIHTMSDFGRNLITWSEKEDKTKIVRI